MNNKQEAFRVNSLHYFLLGPFTYGLAAMVVFRLGEPWPAYIALPGAFLTQAVGYACAHAWMHKPNNYWIHKYHHTYNEQSFVRPIAASAVTITEFFVAYMLPITSGIVLFRPTMDHVKWVVITQSFCHLLIHTPPRCLSMDMWPNFLVTNLKHFHHHEKNVTAHYSAPILDLDGVLGLKWGKGVHDK